MKNILGIILICFGLFFTDINGLRRRCMNTGVLFPDKISRSPIVVYGESLGKTIYLENDTELLFNVTFRVDCILKGQDVNNRIAIVEAGIKENRSACQWLDPGKFYIVFLENCPSNMYGYCPVDFQERLMDEMTYELLEKTCSLTRLPPLHSPSNTCPNVSIAEFCSNDEMEVKIMAKTKTSQDDVKVFKSFSLPVNQTKPKDGLIIDQFADKPRNHAGRCICLSTYLLLLAVIVAMFIEA